MANIINFSTFWQRTKQNKSVFCRNTSSVLKQRVRVQAVLYHLLKNPTSRAEWKKYNVFSWLVEESDESLTLAAQHRNTPRLNVTYLRAFRRPSTLSAGWSFRTFMQPFIWGEKKHRLRMRTQLHKTKQNRSTVTLFPYVCSSVRECVCVSRLSSRTCWRRRWGGRGHREWWLRPWPSCRTGACPRCWNDSNTP